MDITPKINKNDFDSLYTIYIRVDKDLLSGLIFSCTKIIRILPD